jgi:hypothetical protein
MSDEQVITRPSPLRPDGVATLGIYEILGGILLLFAGAAFALDPALAFLIVFAFGYAGIGLLPAETIAATLTLSTLYLAAGWGSLAGRGWAWTLNLMLVTVGVTLNVLQMAVAGFPSVIIIYTGVIRLIIIFLILYYLTRPYVRNFFHNQTATIFPSATSQSVS